MALVPKYRRCIPMALTPVFCRSVTATVLAAFVYGYQLGVLNTSSDAIAATLGFRTSVEGAFVVASLLLGALFSALWAGPLADRIGARKALLWSSASFILGSFVAAVSWGFVSLIVGRLVCGVGCGVVSLCAPRYLAEISAPRIRGAVGSLAQLLICCGILAAYCMGLPYARRGGSGLQLLGNETFMESVEWWRVMLAAPTLLSILQAVLLTASCESPVWLRALGQECAALEAERQLAPPESSVPEQEAMLPTDAEQAPVEALQASAAWSDMFSRKFRRLVGLASSLVALQQLSGINVIVFYSTQVLGDAGLQSPIFGSILLGVVNCVGTVLAGALCDRVGRRPLMAISHAGMAISLLATVLAAFIPGWPLGAVSLFATFSFVAFYSAGSGPLPFVYMSEILGVEPIRGHAASLATALSWLLNLFVGLSFPLMLEQLGIGGSFLIYATLNILGAMFCAVYMVETKQQSLEQIRMLLVVE